MCLLDHQQRKGGVLGRRRPNGTSSETRNPPPPRRPSPNPMPLPPHSPAEPAAQRKPLSPQCTRTRGLSVCPSAASEPSQGRAPGNPVLSHEDPGHDCAIPSRRSFRSPSGTTLRHLPMEVFVAFSSSSSVLWHGCVASQAPWSFGPRVWATRTLLRDGEGGRGEGREARRSNVCAGVGRGLGEIGLRAIQGAVPRI